MFWQANPLYYKRYGQDKTRVWLAEAQRDKDMLWLVEFVSNWSIFNIWTPMLNHLSMLPLYVSLHTLSMVPQAMDWPCQSSPSSLAQMYATCKCRRYEHWAWHAFNRWGFVFSIHVFHIIEKRVILWLFLWSWQHGGNVLSRGQAHWPIDCGGNTRNRTHGSAAMR